MNDPITVGQLNACIKEVLEGTFPELWVEAEISDISRPRSGHVYFTLKDASSQIRGVMWRSTAQRVQQDLGGALPKEGDKVLCFGGVDVYPPRGSYQFNVRRLKPLGLGVLQQRFEALKQKLAAEGLFDADRKRPLPPMPRRVAVVTSPTSAAVRDFLQAAASRFRGVEIIVVPAIVQGEKAVESLVSAIEQASRLDGVDVLVVTRGGGSLEDLWSFNEEAVVRAMASTLMPVVSGVGHEIDVTLADMVADVRALTPTDAATRVTPDHQSLRTSMVQCSHRLHLSVRHRLAAAQSAIDSLADRPVMVRPHDIVRDRFRDLDEWEQSATDAVRRRLLRSQAELEKTAAATEALSPLQTLARGFSVTMNQRGQAVTSPDQVVDGEKIVTQLADGEIQSVVSRV